MTAKGGGKDRVRLGAKTLGEGGGGGGGGGGRTENRTEGV